MKKMRMCFLGEKTFADGFAEYILDMKARNLREGTIHHYQESIKQIYKRIPEEEKNYTAVRKAECKRR